MAYSPNHDDYFVVVLRELLETLNDQVFRMAANDSGKSGMGTTTTVAAERGPNLFVGHVGDSRAHLLRAGELHQLTQDHTWVAEQVERPG